MKKYIYIFLFCFCYLSSYAQNALPNNLISFSSKQGIQLFESAEYKNSYWKLAPYFVTQQTLAYCAIASSTMALNALQIKPPYTPELSPYSIFNQNNFFNKDVAKIITPAKVNHQGATLDEAYQALTTYPIDITRYYGAEITEKDFKAKLIQAVSSDNSVALVNFCRKYIGEKGCGHFSPVAAYNKQADRFLILDVSRYKYPSFWVSSNDLYKAASTGTDSVSHKSRGLLIIEK